MTMMKTTKPTVNEEAGLQRDNVKHKDATPLLPGSTIGVLGGGQLGRMLALDGLRMGYRMVSLDPAVDAPCSEAAKLIQADYGDLDAAEKLGELADVITYEFENVALETVKKLEQEAYLPQGSALLQLTQHRLKEKEALTNAGVPVAPYAAIDSVERLEAALAAFGGRGVLKTATGGYDGKGQRMITRVEDAKQAYEDLAGSGAELVLEAFIPFVMEMSVIAARNASGEIATFPAAENEHVNHILHLSIVPARVPAEVQQEAERLARRIAASLRVIGLIAVEMFVTEDHQIIVNELAPRPHNSGHYTMDACATSQFEQHLRAICNLPLGDTTLRTPVVMANLLGKHHEGMLQWMEKKDESAEQLSVIPKLHWYGKSKALPERKMGHINILADDVEAALQWVETNHIWRNTQS